MMISEAQARRQLDDALKDLHSVTVTQDTDDTCEPYINTLQRLLRSFFGPDVRITTIAGTPEAIDLDFRGVSTGACDMVIHGHVRSLIGMARMMS